MKLEYIVIHCTGASAKQSTAAILNYWKTVKKWKSVGYHILISEDGYIEILSPVYLPTNGVKGYNSKSIHICYKGGVDSTGKAKDTRTDEQKHSLLYCIKEMLKEYPDAKILGHRDLGSYDKNKNGRIDTWERIKECPSFDVFDWLKSINFESMNNVVRVK